MTELHDITSWDEYFMSMAILVGMKSKDTSTRLGAVIVSADKELLSTGYNGLPRNAIDTSIVPERNERPSKYHWYEHSERNSIYNAARIGVSTKGGTMYTHALPCMDCARAIVQAGIVRLVTLKAWDEVAMEEFSAWDESRSYSKTLLHETGIKWDRYDGPLVCRLQILKRGKIILSEET